jgi:alkanesulfonate monooxygenase SsuD/methylene tetrahydromethanopterin reductase-like flavin-dependent oxidoreductase (luciferase family)
VKLGLFMMPMHPPEKPHADAYDLDVQTLVAADRLGYDEAWVGEHFTSGWENIPAPDLILAAALQHTEHIRELHTAVGGFGTLLQLIYDWDPWRKRARDRN